MNVRSKKRIVAGAFALGAALLLAGCISGVPVSITNNSPVPLTHVVVSGTGFSEKVGTIAAGATETIRIRPRVATKVKVSYEADGQGHSVTTEDEIENDDVNTVAATVNPDGWLTIETPLR